MEGFHHTKVDLGGSQAFGLFDLVPVEDFNLEVGRNARRLKSRQRADIPDVKE
jgi:hypothetical protein